MTKTLPLCNICGKEHGYSTHVRTHRLSAAREGVVKALEDVMRMIEGAIGRDAYGYDDAMSAARAALKELDEAGK